MFDFNIIPGTAIRAILNDAPARSIACVKAAYLAHHDGVTVNPDSYFLRFPNSDRNRIIALPASIEGDIGVSGIKWIASFPDNIQHGIPRASAVMVLNDQTTGYPFAVLEASLISAARTAASAVLGAYWLNGQQRVAKRIAFIGAGVIARNILEMFCADDWRFGKIGIYDLDVSFATSFAAYASELVGSPILLEASLTAALTADVVVFATNAGTPYVAPPNAFRPGQIVLNISLRDIAPELILGAFNVVDDIDHCMKANTSPHLAEQYVGHRDFMAGTLAELMLGDIAVDAARPLIFSPFGMGILDLALGKVVFDEAIARGLALPVPDFFGETSRW